MKAFTFLVSRIFILSAVLASLLHSTGLQAQQNWPSKPIRIVITGAAGGPSDILMRIFTPNLQKAFGQPVLIEPKPGAAGVVAAEYVSKQPADGYLLLNTTAALHGVAPNVFKTLPFDPIKDFSGVARLVLIPNVLYVRSDFPVKSVQELIAYAKANPGKVNFSSTGNGTTTQLSSVLFAQMAGIDIVHVPFNGGAPALQAVLGGTVQMSFDQLTTIANQLRAGRVRALAVSSPARSSDIPDVPTVAESGLPGFDVTIWFGIAASSATPRPIINRLSEEFGKALQDQEVIARLRQFGAAPYMAGPTEFDAVIKAEIAKWGPVVKAAGMEAQ